eukprot:3787282-Amphidinium_carterae.1
MVGMLCLPETSLKKNQWVAHVKQYPMNAKATKGRISDIPTTQNYLNGCRAVLQFRDDFKYTVKTTSERLAATCVSTW